MGRFEMFKKKKQIGCEVYVIIDISNFSKDKKG